MFFAAIVLFIVALILAFVSGMLSRPAKDACYAIAGLAVIGAVLIFLFAFAKLAWRYLP